MLAPTTFVTGIADRLAAIDTYGVTESAALPGLSSLNTNFDFEALAGLMGASAPNPQALISSFSAAGGIAVDPNALKAGLIQALPGGAGELAALPEKMKAGILSAGAPTEIMATIGQVSQVVNKADLSSLKSVSSLIGSVSGQAFPVQFKDLSGLSTLGTNLLKSAGALGIPKAYTQFAAGMGTTNLPLLTKITQGILPSVISTSNVSMLVDIATGPVASKIVSLVPGLPKNFLSRFKLPRNASTADIVKLGQKVFSSFHQLKPTWNRTTPLGARPRATSVTPTRNNANAILSASKDFKRVLAVAAGSRVTPTRVQPRVVRVLPSSHVENPSTEFPGATSQATSDSQGRSVTVFTLPNGTIVTRTTEVSGATVSTVYQYPQQGCPAPQTRADNSLYSATTQSQPYNYPSAQEDNFQVMDSLLPEPSSFGVPSYGAGAYGLQGVTADGTQVRRIQASGSGLFVQRTSADGLSVEHVHVPPVAATLLPEGVDPFANTAAETAADPLDMAYVVSNVYEQAQQAQRATGQVSVATQSASQALRTSFPITAFDEAGLFDFVD